MSAKARNDPARPSSTSQSWPQSNESDPGATLDNCLATDNFIRLERVKIGGGFKSANPLHTSITSYVTTPALRN